MPEAVALDRDAMEAALAVALAEARARGVAGKAVTPFLLDRLREATGGRSLAANTALIVANAALAGAVAAALAGRWPRPRTRVYRSSAARRQPWASRRAEA